MANPKRLFLVLLLLVGAQPPEHAQRVRTSRIPPLEPSEWTEVHREALGSYARIAPSNNSLKVCVRNPELCRTWLAFATYFEGDAPALSRHDRQLLILRAAALSHEDYHWGYAARSARQAGLSDEEILRVAKGPDARGWGAADAALLRAADELHRDQFITDATWNALSGRYNDHQLIDLIYTVGEYTMLSMFNNSVGAQLEPGVTGLPK
jgi:alkylhydroperoxidase family enzyme